MATISTANFLTLADNVGKSLVDLESAFQTNPTLNAPTVTTITNGQNAASSSLYARVAGLGDIVQERDLSAGAKTSADNVVAWLGIVKNTFYTQYVQFMNALETHTGGTSAFITGNSLFVHPEFASCFNYFAANATNLALRSGLPTTIPVANVFVPAAQTLGSIAVTGASAGTFSAGTAVNTALYAPGLQLYIKNTTVVATPSAAPTLGAATATVANPSALAGGTYTVGYTFISAAGETALSPTATQTITAGQYINVSSIALPTGATGIKFYASIAVGNTTTGYTGVTLTAAAATAIGDLGAASLAAPASNTAFIASAGTATSFTITYTNAAGTTGQTVTQALGSSLGASATLAAGSATGQAVSNIVVNSSGSNGDSFAVVVQPVRTVTY